MEKTVGHRSVVASLAAVGVALVVVLALPGLVLAAAPPGSARPASGTSEVLWAYGATKNLSITATYGHNASYSITGWFGYHVILTQTNLSSTQFMLELNRTMGFVYDAAFCAPVCGSTARVSANITMRATDHEVGFANFTRAGSVYVNGTSVRALAIQNSAAMLAANLTERSSISVVTPNGTVGGLMSMAAAAHATAAIQFSPALGLIPLNTTAGEAWNSSSGFTAQGRATLTLSFSDKPARGTWQNITRSSSPSVNTSGSVALFGTDDGAVTLRNGNVVPVIVLHVVGPFVPREGVIWLPAGADLFDGASAAYASQSDGTVGASTDAVDWDSHGATHVGLDASTTGFTPLPNAAAAGAVVPVTTPTSPLTAATSVVGAATPAGSQIQGQPESVAQAQTGSQCILGGSCLQSPGSTGPGGGTSAPVTHLAGLFVAVVVVVALAGLLAGLITRRRRTPPPPTAAAPSFASAATLPPPPPPVPAPPPANGRAPPAGEDPLGHVW
ncbi:MAG TPA: hypothetical protein VGV89_09375 [Thermoplasmata archaeon]|nr:hypothetical protein [Thermoplasmata archaeon]